MDDVPTDEQLARIERGVMTRIRRRRQLLAQIASVTAGAVVFVGGFGLLASGIGGAGGSTAGGGTAAEGGAIGSEDSASELPNAAAAPESVVRCFPSSPVDDRAVEVEVGDASDETAVLRACADALAAFDTDDGATPGSRPDRAVASSDLVACIDEATRIVHVFLEPDEQARVCEANGMRDL